VKKPEGNHKSYRTKLKSTVRTVEVNGIQRRRDEKIVSDDFTSSRAGGRQLARNIKQAGAFFGRRKPGRG
jgi:hypothetical protein